MRLVMLRQTWFMGLVMAGLLTVPHAKDDPGRAAHTGDAQTAPSPKPVHELQVVAGRFAYEPASLQVIAGEPVRLVVRSRDTVHGFSIPKLKIDGRIPKGGDFMVIEFTAPPSGRYEIECSEFCGSGHKQMKAALISVAPNVTNQ
jgi:heme/copper-type cytochrome/quinol oxidase subunit 2